MSTLQNAVDFARAQAQTDSNGLTDTIGIIYANESLVDFHRRLVAKGVDASQLQEAYMDSQASVGTYLYPTDMLFLKAIELNYSGAANGYRTAEQVDVSNLNGYPSFSDMRLNADSYNPQFDDRGDWFEAFPTPTAVISQWARIFYFLKPTEYTALTDTIAYPESQDMRILGWRIAYLYYMSLNKLVEASAFLTQYEQRVNDYCETLSRGSQQPIQAQVLQVTGWNF